jgi:transcriptional regulator with XRE-family HTH domain
VERPIAYRGRRFTIAYAVDKNGRSPGKESGTTWVINTSPCGRKRHGIRIWKDLNSRKPSFRFRNFSGLAILMEGAMKTRTQYEELMESPEFRRLYAIEGLVTEASEFIAQLMQHQKVTKAELARRLGKSRAYVTQMLSGKANLTIRTLAEVAYALGAQVKLEAVPLEAAQRHQAPIAASSTIWKVIELRRPPTGWGGETPLAQPTFRAREPVNLQYEYVA